MSRLLAAIKTDFTVQVRNNLYAIGIGVAVVIAITLSQLMSPKYLPFIVPTFMLMVIGGSTLLYVAGMILFEKDEGTLNAVIVSPLTTVEYLWSKVITLTGLATAESVIMIAGTMLLMSFYNPVTLPNIPLLLAGIIIMGIMYTLIGIIMIVRYEKITDFLIPMATFAIMLQLPFLYFLGVVPHRFLFLIPTAAPTLIIKGAYVKLATWAWIYAFGYAVLFIVILAIWANYAFKKHVVMKVR